LNIQSELILEYSKTRILLDVKMGNFNLRARRYPRRAIGSKIGYEVLSF